MSKIPALRPIAVASDSVDINAYLTKDYEDIGEATMELPALMEWLNEVRYDYELLKCDSKRKLARARATTYFSLVSPGPNSFAENYSAKQTEASLEHALALDADVETAQREYDDVVAFIRRIDTTIDNIRSRLESLRSTEASRRSAFNASTPGS